jgi:hypothetical protein
MLLSSGSKRCAVSLLRKKREGMLATQLRISTGRQYLTHFNLVMAICAAVTFTAGKPCAADDDLALPDVLTSVEAYAHRVQDVRFDYVVTTRFQDAKQPAQTEKFEIAWDQLGRQYVKMTSDGSTKTVTWDGKTQKSLVEGGPGASFRTSNKPPSAMEFENNPINSAVRFLGPDTLPRIRKLKSELLRVEAQAADRLYVVRFELWPAAAGKGENTTTLSFSSTHGFAPVKRVVVYNGATWSETTVPELAEVSPGIWMPLKVVCKATPGEGQKSVAEAVVDRKSYAVNTNLPKETFDINTQAPDVSGEMNPAEDRAAPKPAAPVAMRILYAGHPGSAREKDFVEFLGKHFTQVQTGDLATFGDKSADGFAVAILDYDGDGFKAPHPNLSQNYARATVTVGVAGAFIGNQLRLKTGYE